MGDRLALRWVEHRLVVSDDAVWGYWRIPNMSIDLLGLNSQAHTTLRASATFAGLASARCHLVVVPEPWSPRRWSDGLDDATPHPGPGWFQYLERVTERLEGRRLARRAVYLGIQIAATGSGRWTQRSSGLAPEPDDLVWWRNLADTMGRPLAGSVLRARPARATELRWLIQRSFWRGLGRPPARRGEDADGLIVDSVHHHGDHLVLKQPEGRSHVALLAVDNLPVVAASPGGRWLGSCEEVTDDVEASIRFEVVGTDQRPDQADDPVADTQVDLWPRLAVSAPSAGELSAAVSDLVQAYRQEGIALVQPRAHQMALFWEAVPGAALQVTHHRERRRVGTLVGAVLHGRSEPGDRRGPYLGTTEGPLPGPVHFDPLRADRPTTVAITGAGAEGKTTLSRLLAYQLALRGAAVVMVDPGSNAKALVDLPGMQSAAAMHLGPEHAGALDPYLLIADRGQARVLAAGTLTSLMAPDEPPMVEAAVLEATAAVARSPSPSFLEAVRLLAGHPQRAVRAATEAVHAALDAPCAELVIGRGGAPVHLAVGPGQLGLIGVPGPDWPSLGDRPGDERLRTALLLVVSAWCNQLMSEVVSDHPCGRAMVVDEAGGLTRSRVGRALLRRLADGPNRALVLISSLADDLADDATVACRFARFCFRPGTERDGLRTLALSGLEPTDANRTRLRELRNGQCLFTDPDGRSGVLHVDLALDELHEAFDTTPYGAPTVLFDRLLAGEARTTVDAEWLADQW